jgi:hypothetical protein
MKYNFKEGDWFDAQKLSTWQKRWCLENLDFMGKSSHRYLQDDVYNRFMFKYTWHHAFKQCSFGSTDWYHPVENELSFNDFYWGEDISDEDEESSMLTNPKYVTYNKYNDIMDLFLGILEHDKDYKVVESKVVSSGGNKLTLANGITTHDSYFYSQPTREDLLPNAVEDTDNGFEEDTFEGLVYLAPKNDAFIMSDTLSEEQKSFLDDNLDWFDEDRFCEDVCPKESLRFVGDKGWYLTSYKEDDYRSSSSNKASFNDIFVHED